MNKGNSGRIVALLLVLVISLDSQAAPTSDHEKQLLYVAVPGVLDKVRYGGIGILVFDMDNGYKLVQRIPTWEVPEGENPEHVKGLAASAKTGKLYISTLKRVACFDLVTHRKEWERAYKGGADRLALSPDGMTLYVPSLEGSKEGAHWLVADAKTGDVRAQIELSVGAHNTLYSPDGAHVYLSSTKSPFLYVANTKTHTIERKIGPFSDFIRPFTVDGSETLCYVNVDKLLGFEVGNCHTGEKRYRVEIAPYQKGRKEKHSCPSHGLGLTPDETELWVTDANNQRIHVFDTTGLPLLPPKEKTSIALRDVPGWITFSIDGRFAFPSTGEIIDTHTKKIVATLEDEAGRPVQSEKMLEVDFSQNRPIRVGDQFGIGRKGVHP